MKVVTICGSMKYVEEMKKVSEILAKKNGWCVLQPIYDIDKDKTTKEEFDMLKQEHFKRIELSDAIYVVNVDKYLGDSTKIEIEYATKLNKEIFFYE